MNRYLKIYILLLWSITTTTGHPHHHHGHFRFGANYDHPPIVNPLVIGGKDVATNKDNDSGISKSITGVINTLLPRLLNGDSAKEEKIDVKANTTINQSTINGIVGSDVTKLLDSLKDQPKDGNITTTIVGTPILKTNINNGSESTVTTNYTIVILQNQFTNGGKKLSNGSFNVTSNGEVQFQNDTTEILTTSGSVGKGYATDKNNQSKVFFSSAIIFPDTNLRNDSTEISSTKNITVDPNLGLEKYKSNDTFEIDSKKDVSAPDLFNRWGGIGALSSSILVPVHMINLQANRNALTGNQQRIPVYVNTINTMDKQGNRIPIYNTAADNYVPQNYFMSSVPVSATSIPYNSYLTNNLQLANVNGISAVAQNVPQDLQSSSQYNNICTPQILNMATNSPNNVLVSNINGNLYAVSPNNNILCHIPANSYPITSINNGQISPNSNVVTPNVINSNEAPLYAVANVPMNTVSVPPQNAFNNALLINDQTQFQNVLVPVITGVPSSGQGNVLFVGTLPGNGGITGTENQINYSPVIDPEPNNNGKQTNGNVVLIGTLPGNVGITGTEPQIQYPYFIRNNNNVGLISNVPNGYYVNLPTNYPNQIQNNNRYPSNVQNGNFANALPVNNNNAFVTTVPNTNYPNLVQSYNNNAQNKNYPMPNNNLALNNNGFRHNDGFNRNFGNNLPNINSGSGNGQYNNNLPARQFNNNFVNRQ